MNNKMILSFVVIVTKYKIKSENECFLLNNVINKYTKNKHYLLFFSTYCYFSINIFLEILIPIFSLQNKKNIK